MPAFGLGLDPNAIAQLLLEDRRRKAQPGNAFAPQATLDERGLPDAPFGAPGLPGRFAEPTPQRRGLLLEQPKGSTEIKPAWPGQLHDLLHSVGGAEQKAYAGADPSELVPGMTEGALATMAFGAPAARPAGSLGTFLGKRQAEELARRGRPAALDALINADIMEASGKSHEEIRQAAHDIFRQAGEKDFGTVWKPNYPGSEWRFEVADQTAKPGGPKLSKFDPKNPAKPLGEQYTHPDLYAAEPGIWDTELRRYDVGPGATPGRHDPGVRDVSGNVLVPSEIGLLNPLRAKGNARGRILEITAQDQRDNLIAELQHEIQWRNDWPRGGSDKEFMPGGGLEHHLRPGETPMQGYGRLFGEIESKVAKERANYSPKQLRDESVEETLDRMYAPLGAPIIEHYKGGRFRSFGKEDDLEAAQKAFANEQARAGNERAKGLSAAAREQMAREDVLGRKAQSAQRQASELVRQGKLAGKSSEDIAAELEAQFKTKVDPKDIEAGKGWWNAAAPSGPHRWTAETAPNENPWTPAERDLITKLYRQGLPHQEILDRLEQLSGRKITSPAVRTQLRRMGERPRGNMQEKWPREINLALAQMAQKGGAIDAERIARELSKSYGDAYSARDVNQQIERLRLMWGPSRRWGASVEAWQPDALAILKSPEGQAMGAKELAERIYRETGQVTSKSAVQGKRLRLQDEKARAELAEDLANAKDRKR